MITGVFAAFVIYLTTDRTHSKAGLSMSYASVQEDIFNQISIGNIQEIHGVKIMDYENQKIEYYFEYEANALDTLKMIAVLPFAIDDNISNVAPVRMESNTNPLEINPAFTEEIRDAIAFFSNAKAEEFTFYECVKSPMKHTLLISKTSSRILHKVESI
ncbi:MAG TPA: hypothetical protein VFU05_11755 [Cyclobacteriaceae bacterium]|nr:hypothetical protein [Cyclobacteriaceae bacterium]